MPDIFLSESISNSNSEALPAGLILLIIRHEDFLIAHISIRCQCSRHTSVKLVRSRDLRNSSKRVICDPVCCTHVSGHAPGIRENAHQHHARHIYGYFNPALRISQKYKRSSGSHRSRPDPKQSPVGNVPHSMVVQHSRDLGLLHAFSGLRVTAVIHQSCASAPDIIDG